MSPAKRDKEAEAKAAEATFILWMEAEAPLPLTEQELAQLRALGLKED